MQYGTEAASSLILDSSGTVGVLPTCVEGVFTIACNGPQWTMSVYAAGKSCSGNVLDKFVGSQDCAGTRKFLCGYRNVTSAAGGRVSGTTMLATATVVSIATVLLLI